MVLLGSCLYQRSATAGTGPGDNTPRIMDDWGQNVMPEPDRPPPLILPDRGATKKVTGRLGAVTPRGAMLQHLQPVPDAGDFSANHGFVRNSIPGIFAAQVLGPGHPDLQPPDRWHVTPLEAGRRLLTLDTCREWLAGDIDPEDLRTLREANKSLLFEHD